MLPGSLVGCVRWCGRKGASMSLYEEALGCSLASHHLLLPLLSSPPSALLPRDKACWMPVFCARSSWIAQVEKKGFQMHRLQEENLVMVVDQNGASALLVESSQAPKLGLSGPWVAHNSQHPFSPGEMCWQDLLTTSGKEQEMASVWANLMGWKVGKSIEFLGGKYVTLHDGLGAENRHKLSGVFPHTSWPSVESPTWVPFFYASSKEAVEEVSATIEAKYGGKVVIPMLEADGSLAILMDDSGAIFGYYHRTDKPDDIKQY